MQSLSEAGQAMYEQTVKILIAFDKQHSTIAMLLTSWSFSRAKPYGKKQKLLRSGWPAAAPGALGQSLTKLNVDTMIFFLTGDLSFVLT